MKSSQNLSANLEIFWEAPCEALFSQGVISSAIGYSTKWLERKRWEGGGIPYLKVGAKCLYRKSDVINWLETHPVVNSTSDKGA